MKFVGPRQWLLPRPEAEASPSASRASSGPMPAACSRSVAVERTRTADLLITSDASDVAKACMYRITRTASRVRLALHA